MLSVIRFSFSHTILSSSLPYYFVKINTSKNRNSCFALQKRLFCVAIQALLLCKTGSFRAPNNGYYNTLKVRQLHKIAISDFSLHIYRLLSTYILRQNSKFQNKANRTKAKRNQNVGEPKTIAKKKENSVFAKVKRQ